MLLFRRLVIGRPKVSEAPITDHTPEYEEFKIPLKSTLNTDLTLIEKVLNFTKDFPTSFRHGILRDSAITREIHVRIYGLSKLSSTSQILLLCNPSGQTVDTLAEKAVSFTSAIGFDSLIMFDYRPTGRSCKGIVAPDATTMLEDTESVLHWLQNVKDIDLSRLSIAGISLGGVQAMRIASKHREIRRLLLVNTFASFSCLLGSSISLLPGALRLGGVSSFLPNVIEEIKNIKTPLIAVVSAEEDERIPQRCTQELLTHLGQDHEKRILHIEMKGTHSDPKVDQGSLEMIREFLQL
jgi:pimeloyl-ACP methyl ester carboxylesterase